MEVNMAQITNTTQLNGITPVLPDSNPFGDGIPVFPDMIASSNTQLSKQTTQSLEGRTTVVDTAKIGNVEIFDNMRSKMCLIEGPNGKASGFFINEKGLLVTNVHCLKKEVQNGGGFTLFCEGSQVMYKGIKYAVRFPENFNATRADELDLCLLQLLSADTIPTDCFDLLPTSIPLKEGMKAFFAGFPLTQSVLTFHKGHISSIFTKNHAQYFTIDGTVVPGNSGGPVIIMHENKLYLAGVIFAEVADLDPGFLFIENAFNIMRQNGGVGGMSIGIPYPDGQVRSTSPLDIISLSLTVIKKNMSTGIGKAIHVQHLMELLSDSMTAFFLIGPEQSDTLDSELPVIHGTLKVVTVSREFVVKIPKTIFQNAVNFINSFNEAAKKEDFYSLLWGGIGKEVVTIYNFDGGRIDRQPPAKDAANIQIQVADYTIATLAISDELSSYSDNKQKIYEVINYVVRQFVSALNHYKRTGDAIVLKITPRSF
jgi:hypothetical protein